MHGKWITGANAKVRRPFRKVYLVIQAKDHGSWNYIRISQVPLLPPALCL